MTGTALERLEREERIWQLRKEGLSLRRIGEDVGLSHEQVRNILNDRIQQTTDTIEEHRRVMLDRCEEMILGLYPKARNGDVAAVQAILKVMSRQAPLLGLDAQPSGPGVEVHVWQQMWEQIASPVESDDRTAVDWR